MGTVLPRDRLMAPSLKAGHLLAELAEIVYKVVQHN
jgi:hypothetical protein